MRLVWIIAFIFFLILTHTIQAQIEFGAHGGISRTSFQGDRLKLNNLIQIPAPGYHVSLDFYVGIRPDIFLGLSPTYRHMGMKLQTLDTLFEIGPFSAGGQSVIVKTELRDSIRVRLDYLGIPVSLRVISDNERFHFNTGISIGFPVRHEYDNGESREDIDFLKEINLVANFEIGYRIPLNRSCLTINIFYFQGLINMVKNEEEIYEDDYFRLKTVDYGISIGYILAKSNGKDK